MDDGTNSLILGAPKSMYDDITKLIAQLEKAATDSTSIPGKSSWRWAAITCSRGTKRSPSGMTMKRGSSGGTFTRANRRSPDFGSRTRTARFSDRLEMYGKGWPGSTASGVSTG